VSVKYYCDRCGEKIEGEPPILLNLNLVIMGSNAAVAKRKGHLHSKCAGRFIVAIEDEVQGDKPRV